MQAIRNFFDAITYPFRMLARIPSSVISSPRRMLGLSLPVRSALLLFFGLLTILIIWVIVRWIQSEEHFWRFYWYEVGWIPIILVFVIPVIFAVALKLWLEGEPSLYPDIDKVWKEALSKMKEQLIDPAETPIFLILGPSSSEAASNFLSATNLQFPVRVPSGPGPAHVYANQRSIYVVCTQCCCLGNLLGGGIAPVAAPNASPTSFDPSRTMQVGVDVSDVPQAEEKEIPVDRLGLGDVKVPGAMPSAPSAMQGTMMVGENTTGVAPTVAPTTLPSPRLDPGKSSESTAKLAYLCRCIRRIRDPLCPINGVLVATPFTLLADGSQDTANQLQMALKADLAALRAATRVRCSVTHIIDSMEKEAGFRELIRRVGNERAATQRFGKGFGLWNLPTADQLDALVKHACGAFEDWSYQLFREEDGLSKRGNRHLYGLLCRIRTNFLPRLQHMIQSSYSLDRDATSIANREPLLFSGCYFVASGVTPDQQAFLASVFGKTQEEEEDLEWGSEAINEEGRMQAGVRLLMVVNGVLVAAIVTMVVMLYMRS